MYLVPMLNLSGVSARLRQAEGCMIPSAEVELHDEKEHADAVSFTVSLTCDVFCVFWALLVAETHSHQGFWSLPARLWI